MNIKKKGGGGGGANWMDTYGDMVTLLLCFFVLLYSMSTISTDKWKAIVQSFNPNSVQVPMEVINGSNGPSADPGELSPPEDNQEMTAEEMQQQIEQAMERLYQALIEYKEQSAEGQNIEVTKGDGYVFVSFNDAVFFAGEKYDLLPAGVTILQTVSDIFSQVSEYIDEVRVMGHTAQAYESRPNRVRNDRFLSSDRATEATVFIQEHSTLDPARIVSVGYGQWRPVDSNATAESRSHNRRVEILVTGRDVMSALGDSIQKYQSLRDPNTGINY